MQFYTLMDKFLTTLIFICFAHILMAQHERAAFLYTGRGGVATSLSSDYQAIGINPANVGVFPDYPYHTLRVGVYELGASMYSNGISRQQMFDILNQKENIKQYDRKSLAASRFSNSDFVLSMDFMRVGASYYDETWGGVAFNMTDRIRWYSNFNEQVASFAFQGYFSDYFQSLELNSGQVVENNPENALKHSGNIKKGINPVDTLKMSQITEGSQIQFSWFRAYNLNYGKTFNFSENLQLALGLGGKRIIGYGHMNIQAQNGKLKGRGAFNPLMEIDFGEAAENNPSAVDRSTNTRLGKGWGLDAGINLIIHENLKLAASLINYGKINWHTNLYKLNNNVVYDLESGGMDSYNIFTEANKFGGENGIFEYEGMRSYQTRLPAVFRTGISYSRPRVFQTGIDVILPQNQVAGNYREAIYAAGFEYNEVPWVKLSTGLVYGGNYVNKLNVSFGTTFVVENWELGFATRDISTYLGSDKPNIALSAGLLRAGITF